MENTLKITVSVELSEATKAFLHTLLGGMVAAPAQDAKRPAPAPSMAAPVDENEDEAPARRRGRPSAEKEEPAKDEAPARRRGRPSAEKEAPAKDEAPARRGRPSAAKEEPKAEDKPKEFKDLGEAEQLEEIKAKITLTTKKKGGATDVRELLGVFDAGRAGELDPKDYEEFYDALTRYRNGESVDEIFPQID